MKEFRPAYYDRFRCVASACPDSCCHEWEIEVDPQTAEKYRNLPGELGERLRGVLTEEDGAIYFVNESSRCPMWRSDGLCRLQADLGEQALCQTCREFPRIKHDYGDFRELGLELSCPEAARLILSDEDGLFLFREAEQTEEADYDGEAMSCLKRTRSDALTLLYGNPNEAAARLLLYGYAVQEELDGGEEASPEVELTGISGLAASSDLTEILSFFRKLDILTSRWEEKLTAAKSSAPLPEKTLPLLRYFVNRYWLQAVSDYDLCCRVKFMVVSALLIAALPGEYIGNAQLYSKEIENSAGNMDALLDAMYTEKAFTDAQILGFLKI